MDKICRLCFFVIDTGGYELVEERGIMTKINSCLRLELRPNEHFPKKICKECYKKIKDIYKFREGVIQNERKLWQHLGSNSLESLFQKVTNAAKVKAEKLAENSSLNEDKPFICSYCSKGFKKKSNMTTHVKIHTGEGWHLCTFCGKQYARKSTMLEHQKIRHPKEYSESFKKERLKRPGVMEIIEYVCTQCNFTGDSQQELTVHLEVHSENPQPVKKLLSCRFCSKQFKKKSALTAHENIHTGEGRRLCPDCGKTYSQKSYLRKHQKNFCNKLKYFTQEKPSEEESALQTDQTDCMQVCGHCGRIFQYMSTLLKHQKKHHPGEYEGMVVEALDHQYVSTYETVKSDSE